MFPYKNSNAKNIIRIYNKSKLGKRYKSTAPVIFFLNMNHCFLNLYYYFLLL